MMPIYLGMVWNRRNRLEVETANRLKKIIGRMYPDWEAALDEEGVYLAIQPRIENAIERTYMLPGSRGIVLGKLFERSCVEYESDHETRPRDVVLGEALSARVIADRGATLGTEFWGSYVAFLRDSSADSCYVLRDPTGEVPCQRMIVRGVSLYFVRLADVDLLGESPSEINNHFLVSMLAARSIFSGETAYTDVYTLLPGQRATHSSTGVATDFYWSATAISRAEVWRTPDDLVAEVRRTVRGCVSAWASCFDHIALQLSGGLDSSIVAACLGKAAKKAAVTYINFFDSRETTDERAYARSVAEMYGNELLEMPMGPSGALDFLQTGRRIVVPTDLETQSDAWSGAWDAMRLRKITQLFRGDGGDELFYRDGPLPDAVDFAFVHGIKARLWSIAWNDALIEGTSVWRNVKTALRFGYLRRPDDWKNLRYVAERPLLSLDVRKRAASDLTNWHPLYRDEATVPPAKLRQSYRLLAFTCRYHPGLENPAEVPNFAPLISQPHMEMSLRTPLSLLRHGGLDRAMARRAFMADLPAKIVTRRYKGLFTRPVRNWIDDNLNVVRELLLDGYLAREGILDRAQLESMFAKQAAPASALSSDLLACASCEVWIRNAKAAAGHARERLTA